MSRLMTIKILDALPSGIYLYGLKATYIIYNYHKQFIITLATINGVFQQQSRLATEAYFSIRSFKIANKPPSAVACKSEDLR